jgi:hypothetical protein
MQSKQRINLTQKNVVHAIQNLGYGQHGDPVPHHPHLA